MDVRPIALTACLVALISSTFAAAPFVPGDPQPFSKRIAACRAAVTARPVDAVDLRSGWTVVTVLRDNFGTVERGALIRPRPAPPRATRLALLVSNVDRTIAAEPLSEAAAAYLSSIMAAAPSTNDRLRLAGDRLDDPDPQIAQDAFSELAQLTAAELERHRDLLPTARLRQLVESHETPADRMGFYGFLLGLCGTPEDAARLRRRFLESEGFASGADGLAAGYLMLTGEAGLADLEETVLMTQQVSPFHAAAVLEALAVFRSETATPFTRDRLRQAACCGLVRADAADLAIAHLAACRDWEATDEVVAALSADDRDATRKRAVQVTAVRFLLECRRDVDAALEVRAAAGRVLDRIASNDADLLRRATQLSGGPDERR